MPHSSFVIRVLVFPVSSDARIKVRQIGPCGLFHLLQLDPPAGNLGSLDDYFILLQYQLADLTQWQFEPVQTGSPVLDALPMK